MHAASESERAKKIEINFKYGRRLNCAHWSIGHFHERYKRNDALDQFIITFD